VVAEEEAFKGMGVGSSLRELLFFFLDQGGGGTMRMPTEERPETEPFGIFLCCHDDLLDLLHQTAAATVSAL
jgi:hypothetical protein